MTVEMSSHNIRFGSPPAPRGCPPIKRRTFGRPMSKLKNRILPDSATLAAAGISQDSAAELLRALSKYGI